MTKPSKYTPPQAFSDDARAPIVLHPVQSNQVRAIGYDEATQTLAVTFTRSAGAIYHYPNVTKEAADAFINAESIGRHFGQYIKQLPFTKYQPEPVPAPEPAEQTETT